MHCKANISSLHVFGARWIKPHVGAHRDISATPGAIDDLIRVFQDVLAPRAAEQPGFSGTTLLIDTQTNTAVAIGLWATEVDLLAAEHEQSARIEPLLAGPPARRIYEVSVQVELTDQSTPRIHGI